MEFAPAGVSLSFEVTFDSPSLFVAMSVYDDSGLSPVLVSGPTAMLNVVGNTYRGKFTAEPQKSYIILKAVYTDGTFTTLNPSYAQGSESLLAEFLVSPAGCEVIGYVDRNDTVIGSVDSNAEVIGLVDLNQTVIGSVQC